MNKKGFTEAQFILFAIFFCIAILVILPLTNYFVNKSKSKKNDEVINTAIEASKNWLNSIENKEEKDGKAYYISVPDLVKLNYLSETDLDGCIKIVYQENYKEYKYTYSKGVCQNVIDAKDLLMSKVVTSGDGLYKTDTEYLYRGSNPDNYIKINDNIYRIIKFTDKGIKIISEDIKEQRSWDSPNIRTSAKNSYCGDDTNGCNAYIANENDVTQDSEIHQYLQNAYTIKDENSLLNNKGIWEIGTVKNIDSTELEKELSLKTITSSYGLININDYKKASLNKTYRRDNWLNISESYWTLTSVTDTNNMVWSIGENGRIISLNAGTKIGVRPVLNINNNIKLTGEGTKEVPYEVKR